MKLFYPRFVTLSINNSPSVALNMFVGFVDIHVLFSEEYRMKNCFSVCLTIFQLFEQVCKPNSKILIMILKLLMSSKRFSLISIIFPTF